MEKQGLGIGMGISRNITRAHIWAESQTYYPHNAPLALIEARGEVQGRGVTDKLWKDMTSRNLGKISRAGS